MKRFLSLILACLLLLTAVSVSAEELTTIKVMAINNAITINGETTYFSDVLEGKIKSDAYDKLVADLAARGLAVEFDVVTSDQYPTYLRNQIAGGIKADVYCIKPLDDTTRLSMAKSGQFLPISTLEQFSNGALLDWLSDGYGRYYARDEIDGELYWLPRITVSADYNGVPTGNCTYMFIRQDWLDMLEMEVPQTLDELYDYIIACRENDLNHTGVEDEMIKIPVDSMNDAACWFGLFNSWYYVGEDGQFTTPWYHEEQMKAYISFLNKLYSEGVLETTSASDVLQSENKLIGVSNWASRNLSITVADDLPTPLYTPIVFNALENYPATIVEQCGIDYGSAVFAVNGATEKVEAVAKLLDYLYTDEYIDLSNYGVEGIQHIVDEDGSWIAPEAIEGNYDNSKARAGKYYANFNEDLPSTTLVRGGFESSIKDWAQINKDFILNSGYGHDYAHKLQKTPESSILALATEEEAKLVASLKTDVETYMGELLSKLVFGEKSLDDWNTYMNDLDELGLGKIIEVYQTRYERTPDDLKLYK